MKKPKATKRVIMDYHQMQNYIEEKYKCDLGDYAAHKNGIKSTCAFNVDHEEKWKLAHYPQWAEFRKNPAKNYGMNQKALDWGNTPEGIRFFNEVRKAYGAAPDGECKELPFWCFWHYMLDCFDISNGVTRLVNWAELAQCGEDWQKEICQLFATEFGEGEMEVEFAW